MYKSIPDNNNAKWDAFKVFHLSKLMTLTGTEFRELLKDCWYQFGNPCNKKAVRDKDHALAFTSRKEGGRGKQFKKGSKGKGGGDAASMANGTNKPKKERPDITCFNCDKPGHFASDCKEPKKEKPIQFAAATSSKKQTKSNKTEFDRSNDEMEEAESEWDAIEAAAADDLAEVTTHLITKFGMTKVQQKGRKANEEAFYDGWY
ncbi:hypothetical protein MPSEU_000685500 [Mayamaea pseudoterrestris]|nr:hypothetical protein MPSEU_000685500 [Mayamaea pseudoterrestris]